MALGVSKKGLRFIPFEPETVYTVVGKSVEKTVICLFLFWFPDLFQIYRFPDVHSC